MTDLADKKCIPCEGGIPGFEITEIHKYLKMVDGWEVKADDDKIYYLIKEFKFKNFLESQRKQVKFLIPLQVSRVQRLN